MKALVVYSDASGRKDFSPHVGFVKKELVTSFEALDFKHISSEEEADSVYAEAAARYGAIIVCGGDGSFNRAVNVIMGQPQKPILGYINFGTIGDVGKNFGVRRNMKKAIHFEGNTGQHRCRHCRQPHRHGRGKTSARDVSKRS